MRGGPRQGAGRLRVRLDLTLEQAQTVRRIRNAWAASGRTSTAAGDTTGDEITDNDVLAALIATEAQRLADEEREGE